MVWAESEQCLYLDYSNLSDYSMKIGQMSDFTSNLVDPASSHMLISKIKPCKSKYKLLYNETANSSLQQL